MNQGYFEKWSEFAQKAHLPFQAIAELNMKAMQDLTYIKPEELTQVKKPEDLLERQIRVVVANGHIALNYMQKTFQIFEDVMLSAVQDVKNKTDIRTSAGFDGKGVKAEGKAEVKK